MIIGLDIGRNGSAVACPLIALPENLKKYLKSPDYPIIPIKPSHKDFDYLLELNPKGIVLEPTGGWYSQIWAKFGEVYNIPIYWCGHADLKAQRGHFGFPNKYDDNDALCLTASYYDPYFIDEFGRKRFLEHHLIKAIQHIERYKSKSDAWQKRNISLQCFQAYFGLSRRIEQSGQTEKIKWSGSKLLRSKMYMWIIARISSRKARIKNKLGEQLGAKWDELTRDGIASGKDAGMRVEFLANRALFQRLRDEIVF